MLTAHSGWSIGRSPAMYMYGQPAASQPASRPGPYRSSCSYMLMHACNAAMRATASSWLQPCMYTALASAPSEALSYMYYMCYMAVLAPLSTQQFHCHCHGLDWRVGCCWLAGIQSIIHLHGVRASQSVRQGTAMYYMD